MVERRQERHTQTFCDEFQAMITTSLHAKQHGYTIVEFMLAITLGLFLLGGIAVVFASSKQTYRMQDSLWQLQDNSRFAMEFLIKDLRMSGFRGCNGNDITPINTLNNGTDFNYDFMTGLQGFDASASGWLPALPSALAAVTPSLSADSDVITIRRAQEPGINITAPFMNNNSAALHVDAGNGLNQFDIVLVTDCSAAAILQISGANPGTSGTIAHNTGVGTPGNATSDLGKIFLDDAEIMKLITVSYFIAPDAAGTGSRSLWRKVADGAPEELAAGVENMQVLYGEDTDNDRSVNRYVTADNVTDMDQVRSLKLSFLMATLTNNITSSPQPYTFNGVTVTPADRKLRRVFSTVVNLRNRTM
jgi:type IV pilus assembly protein PilW